MPLYKHPLIIARSGAHRHSRLPLWMPACAGMMVGVTVLVEGPHEV